MLPPGTDRSTVSPALVGYSPMSAAGHGSIQEHFPNGRPQILDQHGKPWRRQQKVPSGEARPGGLALPPGYVFVAAARGGDYTFWHDLYDRAIQHGRQGAIDMLNDAYLRSLLQERMLASSSLKWHLEVPDEKDPFQMQVKDGLTRQVKAITLLPRIIPWHFWAIWYGRSGVQVEWEPTVFQDRPPAKEGEASGQAPSPQAMAMMRSRRSLSLQQDRVLQYLRSAMLADPGDRAAQQAHGDRMEQLGLPRPGADVGTGVKTRKALNISQAWEVNGDKIGHQEDHTPYILVNSAYGQYLKDLDPHASLINTTVGTALSLRGTWRERFLLHMQYSEDRDFFLGATEAEAMHGVGVRSHLYWMDFLKKDFLARVSDFYDRLGLGVSIWTYPSGNVEALNAAKQAATQQSDRANLFVPVIPGMEKSTGLERVEVPTAGAGELIKLVEYFDKQMERLVVGQEGSASATSSSGHSNQSSTEFQISTKEKIVRQDALWHAISMTGTKRSPGLVSIMQQYSYPEADFPVKWVYDFETQESEKKLQAIKTVVDMGIKVKADDARAAAGLSKPADGDELVKPPQQGGAPGAPGGGGGNPLAALMGGGGAGGAPPAEGAPDAQAGPPTGDQPAEQPAGGQPEAQGDFLDALRQMREATQEALRFARAGAVEPGETMGSLPGPEVVHHPPFASGSVRHARLASVVNHLRRAGKGELADEVVRRFSKQESEEAADEVPVG